MQKLGELDKLLNRIERSGRTWGLASTTGVTDKVHAVIFNGNQQVKAFGTTRLEALRKAVRQHNKLYESARIG